MKSWKYLFFVAAAIFFAWLGWASTTHAGGEDGVCHYLFARYAPQHPQNFLDLWAKPAFTLLLTPFAQIGFFASIMFNVMAGLLAARFTYKSAEKLGFTFPFLSAPFLLLSVIYFSSLPSVITEVLFSLFLAAGIFSLLKGRYIGAAVLISFLPLIRQEGYIFIPLFLLCLIFLRQYKSLPWLLFGITIYSVVGGFYFGDFLWLINSHPYSDASDIYGRGDFLHYINLQRHIWGTPLLVLMLLGTIVFIAQLVGKIRKNQVDSQQIILLFAVFGSFYAFLFGHSYVWWKGSSASLGLIRVMASTMPAAVIIGHYGLHWLLDILNPRLKLLRYTVAAVALYAFFTANMQVNHSLPFGGDKEKEMIISSAEAFHNSPYQNSPKVYYFAPSVALYYDVDPYDHSQAGSLCHVLNQAEEMPSGAIVVWDGHFGPNECRLPLSDLKDNPLFEQVGHFEPEEAFTTLNGYQYEIYWFRKK